VCIRKGNDSPFVIPLKLFGCPFDKCPRDITRTNEGTVNTYFHGYF
jgi:hypothetical protein